jgi:hypothetical protein
MKAALLLAMLAAGVLPAASVHTDFEGSSLGGIEKVSDVHLRLSVAGQKDQNGRNRQASWYYFRIDDAGDREMVLDMVDLPGEYNFKPNRGAITGDTPPVISYDGRTWTHVQTFEYDATEPKLRLRIKPAASRFWIAHTPPYTNENLTRLRNEIAKNPAFREEKIGKTLGGRDLVLWTIANGVPGKTVWLMFRQHAWESGSSWVGEGAVRALLSPEAAGLRESITWKILPLCDPDGVAGGGVRFNRKGYDLNRNWDTLAEADMPEITAQRRAIATWIKRGHKVDLFFSLHNTETSEYLEGTSKYQPLGEKFFDALKQVTKFAPTRPLFLTEVTTTPGMAGRMNVIQGLFKDFQIPGFLMEQRIAFNNRLGHLPTIDDRLAFGGQLVLAIKQALQ